MNRQELFRHVWQIESDEILRLSDEYDVKMTNRLIDVLLWAKDNGHRIFTAGVGTSAAAAKKIAHSFCCIEFSATFLSPGDSVHGGLGAVQNEDVAILISKGGATKEITNMLSCLKKKHVIIVGVTESLDSILGKECDILIPLHVSREPDDFNMLATASTLKVVAYFDAVIILLMSESGYTKEQFAIIHPGGAVGDRLLRL